MTGYWYWYWDDWDGGVEEGGGCGWDGMGGIWVGG